MTVRDLIEVLEEFDLDTQIFVQSVDLHDAVVAEYNMDDLPSVVVIS
jgi:hypothetical protein